MRNNTLCFKGAVAFFLANFILAELVLSPALFAQLQDTVDSAEVKDVVVYIGDLVSVKVKSLTRVALANAGFVDISSATADEIILIGRKEGQTTIYLWDENGKRKLNVRVFSEDLDRVAERIGSRLRSSGIEGVYFEKNVQEGKLILTGFLNPDDRKKFDEIVKDFKPYFIDLIKEQGDLIEIDVQISELSKTLSETLGFDWAGEAEDTFRLGYQETLPAATGKFADLFKIGDFNRTQFIQATVNAMIIEGKGRVLSKPSIVVTNGEEATFNVGGEIPIRTTTTANTGITQENVTFKSYGIDMTVKPEIKDGKIDITMDLAIRDIDSANAVGDNVAFTTRKASTKILVNDGQLIVLAGLIKRNKSESVNRLPFLSRIPVVGMLFKVYSTPSPNSDLELVISLRPRIYGKNKPVGAQKTAKESVKPDVSEPKADGIQASKEVMKELTKEDVLDTIDSKTKDEKDRQRASQDVKIARKKSAKEEKEAKKKAVQDEKLARQKAAKEKKERVAQEKKDKKKKKAEPKAKKPAASKSATKEKSSEPLSAVPPGYSTELSSPPKGNGAMSIEDAIIAMERTQVPEPTAVMSEEQIAALKSKYTEKLKREMSETISYPYEAKEFGWQGTVTLDVTILPDGNVKDVKVNRSSGRAIFDTDAVNTAQILAPYDTFTPAKNLREVSITIPVEYSEKAVLGNGNGNGSAEKK